MKRMIIVLIISVGLIVMLVGVGLWLGKIRQIPIGHKTTTPTPISVKSSPTYIAIPTPLVTVAPPLASPATQYYFPIADYTSRRTNRWYGKYITPADAQVLLCGAPFQGYHDGDDLEVKTDELNQNIPIYAIANGTVVQANYVSGYGGLIVIRHDLGGQVVTAYYGHIDLSKTLVSAGQTVKPGQQISSLGAACSSQTDGERKHLHFAIHKGSTIDVRGYAPDEQTLQQWLDPLKILDSLHATSL